MLQHPAMSLSNNSGPAKWISKRRVHGTLRSIVGHLGDCLLIVSRLKFFLFFALFLFPFCLFPAEKSGGPCPPSHHTTPGLPEIAGPVTKKWLKHNDLKLILSIFELLKLILQ